ncbi:hypothetical protein EX895_003370 [Sporisorium graminicola]|uniref:Uncharacterized protein n=1 Tax=Sporisorium graminicola TaxID=280036 RepID=A0A4V6EU22_9BASI|nr:hypothetical protein EX895_003370 [Sporisorium graminicola]TKY87789.1 hypothetical protein EX895_003370 [Sporisorium graminicola]
MLRLFQLLPLLLLFLTRVRFSAPRADNFWEALHGLAERGEDIDISSYFATTHQPPGAESGLSTAEQHASANPTPPGTNIPHTMAHPALTPQERMHILAPIGEAYKMQNGIRTKSTLHPYAGAGAQLTWNLVDEALGATNSLLREHPNGVYVVRAKTVPTEAELEANRVGRMGLTGRRRNHVYVWKRVQPPNSQGMILHLVGAVNTGVFAGEKLAQLPAYRIPRAWQPVGPDAISVDSPLMPHYTSRQGEGQS